MKAPKSFFLLILLFAFPVFAQSGDEPAVRETVEKFCDAVIQRDIGKFKETTDSGWSEKDFADWQTSFERGSFAEYPLRSFTIRTVSIEAEKATVRVFWERFDAKTNKAVIAHNLNHWFFYLKKQNSQWKVSNNITVENDLIARILQTDSFEERKQLIRSEPELNTHRIIFVILFRLQSDGKYEQTEEFYKLAEWYNDEFYKGKDEHRFVNTILNVLNSRALTEKSLGNYADAMRFYLESVKIADEYQIRTKRILGGTALTQVNIGSLYFQQGNLEQAEKFALDALNTLKDADRNKQNVLFNSIFNLLGDIYFQRGDLPKAFEFYTQARDEYNHGIGAILIKQNKLTEALKIFQASIDRTNNSIANKEKVNLPLAVESLVSVSEIYRRQNDVEKSLSAACRAVEFAEQSKNPALIFAAQTALGKVFLTYGKFDEAESAFRKAIETVEAGRQKVVGGEESRILYFENRVEPYQKMVEIAVKRGDAKTALEFSERGKSRTLNEILQAGKIDWRKVLNESDKQKEQNLREKLSELNRLQTVLKYQTTVDKKRLDETTKQIEQVRSDYDFLQTSVFANYAELRRSRNLGETIKADEIAALIRHPDEALLEFALSDERIFLFVATKDKSGVLDLKVYPLEGKTDEIINLINAFRQKIIDKNLDYKADARRLFDLLFGKISAQIAGKANLTIIPDAELWNVPFAALSGKDGRFLIESKTLNFAQSLTALKELNNIKSGENNGSLLALGNPRLDEKTVSLVRAQSRNDLGDLPEAETEVLALQKLYGNSSRILTKSEAREDVWKAESSKYRYLHLATHGFANSIKPLYSHLFLAADKNQTDDGLLEAWEVMNLRLNADFVVLSACETGRGRAGKGEGLIGLSWVFAVANVPRVLASQWKVDERGTAELMTEFHRNLKFNKNNSVAKSLQTAMQKQLKNPRLRHPFYWSGFISIGRN